MGSLIGDALGLGYHWYYDVKAMRRDFGDWFRDYHDGKPDRDDQYDYIAKWRCEFGLRTDDLSQTGQIAVLLLGSFAEHSGCNESDFCVRLDQLFSELDGTDLSGRYTDRAVRDTWADRKVGAAWASAGSSIDTAEAAIWNVMHAAHSNGDMRRLASDTHASTKLTHNNDCRTGGSTAFILAVAALVDGVSLDDIQSYMFGMRDDPEIRSRTSSNDITFQIGNAAARMGADSDLDIDARTVSIIRARFTENTVGMNIENADNKERVRGGGAVLRGRIVAIARVQDPEFGSGSGFGSESGRGHLDPERRAL